MVLQYDWTTHTIMGQNTACIYTLHQTLPFFVAITVWHSTVAVYMTVLACSQLSQEADSTCIASWK